MTICPASVPVRWSFAGSQKGQRENRARHSDPEGGAEELEGILNAGDILMAGPMERGGRQDEDRAIDEEREHEGGGRVDGGEFDGLTPALGVLSKFRVWTTEEWR